MLVKYNGIIFSFEKTTPERKCYFVYHSGGFLKGDGKFDLTLRHWNILETYGNKSKLNSFTKNNNYYIKIIELDKTKTNNVGIIELLHDRDVLYFWESFRDASYIIILGFLITLISPIKLGLILAYIGIVYIGLSLFSLMMRYLWNRKRSS